MLLSQVIAIETFRQYGICDYAEFFKNDIESEQQQFFTLYFSVVIVAPQSLVDRVKNRMSLFIVIYAKVGKGQFKPLVLTSVEIQQRSVCVKK